MFLGIMLAPVPPTWVSTRLTNVWLIELTGYLENVTGPVSLVLDLRITHERWVSNTDPSINGHLHYPNDIDSSLNESVTDKIRKYRADYNNNPPNSISFMSAS